MEKINFFSADFRDGRVRIGNKTYPAGTFATHLLNQYYKDDRLYVQTNNEKYFYWFLHYYEPQMNYKAKWYRKTYSMTEHFSDIKQSLAIGLCKALIHYDISKSPFLPYAERYMEREAHNYIRTMQLGYSIQSEFEYARLRKAMAIFKKSGGELTEGIISQVAEQIGESYDKTKSIIEGGIFTEGYVDIQREGKDDDNEETTDFLLPDSSLNPENIYFEQELYDKLYVAYNSLEYTEKIMLSQHFGFCPDCFGTHYADKGDLDENGKPKQKPIKPLPYTDIATAHGFSDADTAKRVCEKAIKKLSNHIKQLRSMEKNTKIEI